MPKEMPSRSVKRKPQNATPILVALVAACVTLDAINVIGVMLYPAAVAKLACFILPVVSMSKFAVSESLLNYATNQCHNQPVEPTPSIIFFMAKVFLAILSAAAYVVVGYMRSVNMSRRCPEMSGRLSRDRLLQWVNSSGSITAGMVILCIYILVFVLASYASAEEYNNSMYWGKITEDFLIVVLFVTAIMLIDAARFLLSTRYDD